MLPGLGYPLEGITIDISDDLETSTLVKCCSCGIDNLQDDKKHPEYDTQVN